VIGSVVGSVVGAPTGLRSAQAVLCTAALIY